MTWKAKNLIEFLQKNYKDDDTIFAYIYDKAEVQNAFDIEATDSEWEQIAESLGGSYSADALYEEFSEGVGDVLGHLRCEDCYDYHRDLKTHNEENLCSGCIEGRKAREVALAEIEAQRNKEIVKPDEDIIY